MRKRLVVVGSIAAAILIAGGIAATTAGADEAPDVPSIPGVTTPDLPDLPQLPGEQDAAGQDAAGQDAVNEPGQDGPGQADQNQADQSQDDQAAQDQAAQDQAAQDQAAQDQAAVQAQDQDSQRPGATGDQNQGAARGGAARPAQQRPTQQRPAQQRPADHKPMSLTAAAQREVSPGSVSTSSASPVQQQVLSLVNENRRRGGCDDLSLDRRLITAAFGHAADMARRGYFAHESPNGEGAGDRVQDAGYKWSRYGENIARGPDSAYEVVDGWMHSPEHRENIMDCRLHQMGVGLAFDGGRTPYWVQDFGTPW